MVKIIVTMKTLLSITKIKAEHCRIDGHHLRKKANVSWTILINYKIIYFCNIFLVLKGTSVSQNVESADYNYNKKVDTDHQKTSLSIKFVYRWLNKRYL